MRRHPKAGQPVTIKSGKLEGKIFHVIDYVETMHQGKSIDRIKLAQIQPVRNRGLPIDSDIVWGKFHPSMEFGCVHDSELKLKIVDEKPVEKEDPKITSIKKSKKPKKDFNGPDKAS